MMLTSLRSLTGTKLPPPTVAWRTMAPTNEAVAIATVAKR